MRRLLIFVILPLITVLICSDMSQMQLVPGEMKVDPDFIEIYHGQRHQVQLNGVCMSVRRLSLPAIFSSKLNSSTMSSMRAHFRGLYLSSQGSAKAFMNKLMSSLADDSSLDPAFPSAETVMAYDKKKEKFVCTHPLFAQCKITSAPPHNSSLDVNSDSYGTTDFSARFSVGSSDASVLMCSATDGPRRPLVLLVNTLPTLNELVASFDESSKDVMVRCSGVMSSIFSSVYQWELFIVSPAGDSYRLDEWSNINYANDKPEPGLMSATLTANLPVSRIPVSSVTFYCQIVDILGRTFVQRLSPFVLESVMQLPHNVKVVLDKLSPLELLGALPNPPPVMMPLSTIYRLRCSFDSVSPQLISIVWESYGFDPRSASFVGKRHSLDHQFILLNESLYNKGHHLCRVWRKTSDPATSICSDPLPPPRRTVPLCTPIPRDTNISSLITDLVAFVPLGENRNNAPSRDLVVQSMTTALIVLSCVSGIFFLCLIMMIGRFHCRLRPLVRGDTKRLIDKKNVPLLSCQHGSDSVKPRPSISRRFSYPGENRSADVNSPQSGHTSHDVNTTKASEFSAPYRLFAPPRPAIPNRLVFSTNQQGNHVWMHAGNGGRQHMTSVGCEADLDKADDECNVSLNYSQLSQAVPLLASKSDSANDSQGVVVTATYKRGDLSSPTFPHPSSKSSAPSETPAPVNTMQTSLSSRRSSSSTALNSSNMVPLLSDTDQNQTGDNLSALPINQQPSAKSRSTIAV